jgi:hypothetical protein
MTLLCAALVSVPTALRHVFEYRLLPWLELTLLRCVGAATRMAVAGGLRRLATVFSTPELAYVPPPLSLCHIQLLTFVLLLC